MSTILISGVIIAVVVVVIWLNTRKPTYSVSMPKVVKIDEVKIVLGKLRNGEMKNNFFGIHSNGIDCIYFTFDQGYFDIEFEAMLPEQVPFIEKLGAFAADNNLEIAMHTYGNTPHYKSDKSAPVITIKARANFDNIIMLAEKIEMEIFNNNKETVYEVVP